MEEGGAFEGGNGGGHGAQGAGASSLAQSVPHVLHFLQREMGRYERDRAMWAHERALLQARIGFLEGQKKGEANMKRDLLRRIKMLEYALQQERAKARGEGKEETKPAPFKPVPSKEDGNAKSWLRQGRQTIIKYLSELGYTDQLIHAQSQRMTTLMESWPPCATVAPEELPSSELPGGAAAAGARKAKEDAVVPADSAEAATDAFDFLKDLDPSEGEGEGALDDGEQAQPVEGEGEEQEGEDEDVTAEFESIIQQTQLQSRPLQHTVVTEVPRVAIASKPLQHIALAEAPQDEDLEAAVEQQFGRKAAKLLARQSKGHKADKSKPAKGSAAADVFDFETQEDLGGLADLAVGDSSEAKSDASTIKTHGARKQWKSKITLKSHLDSVRSIAFHPSQPLLVSGSEDKTIKVWRLPDLQSQKKPTTDLEPIATFRGHSGAVLSLAIDEATNTVFSASQDGSIRSWHMPTEGKPYEAYTTEGIGKTFIGHSDSVWSLDLSPVASSAKKSDRLLLSASSDGTCRVWSTVSLTTLAEWTCPDGKALPLSAKFVKSNPNHAVVAYTSSRVWTFDVTTGQPVVEFTIPERVGEDDEDSSPSTPESRGRIYALDTHDTPDVVVTGWEDRHLRFFDPVSGKCVHSMVAHGDTVSCVAIDHNGLYCLSGGHDRSVRVWDMASKACLDEATTHRKKYDEAVHALAWHMTLPYFASAGADATIRIFA